jgi:hypothetical protein
MKHIIIVDIDGTIQKIGDRKEHLKESPPNYDLFHDKFEEDEPIEHMCRLISILTLTRNIVFVTQRPKRLFKQTGHWIRRYTGLTSFHLHMRVDNDLREPEIVKPELITKHVNVDDILFAIDDSDKVIKAYCKLGIECIKVIDSDKAMKPKRMRRRVR